MNNIKKTNNILFVLMLSAALIGLPYVVNDLQNYKNANLIVLLSLLIGFLIGLGAVFLEKEYFLNGANTSKTIWFAKIVIFGFYPLLVLSKNEIKLCVMLAGSMYFATLALFFFRRKPKDSA